MYIFYNLYSYKSYIILIKKIWSYYRYLKCFDFCVYFVETEEHIHNKKSKITIFRESNQHKN